MDPRPVIMALVAWLLVTVQSHGQDPTEQAYRACMDSCDAAEVSGVYDDALRLLQRAEGLAKTARDTARMADVLVKRGVIRQRQADYNMALGQFYAALLLYEAIGDANGLAEVYNNIGSVHHYDKNYRKAREYYGMSLRLRKASGTPSQLAVLYNNFGALLEDMGRPDSALSYHRQGLAIRTQLRDTSWMAVCYMNIGTCHLHLAAHDSARLYLLRSSALLRATPNRYLRGSLDYRLGMVDLADGAPAAAIRHCEDALATAVDLRLAPLMQQCYLCLHEAFGRTGDAQRAYALLKRYVALRDSVFGEERVKELTRIEMNHAFERQQFADSLAQAELRREADAMYQQGLARERDQRNLFLFSAIAVLGLAGGLWSRLRYMRRSRAAVQRERERSDRLLLNILPRGVAEELKEHGTAKARDVNGVSILFTDFADFTPLSAGLSAQELVATINTCFTAFDAIVERYGLEKIKTIGDAYMAAGGLPEPRSGSAQDTVLAALDMQDYMTRFNNERAPGGPIFAMRAGIHTGDVVAGIVGRDKFQYDIWGEPVNIASRMESGGTVGRVNISRSTYRLVKDDPRFAFVARGDLFVKGRGELAMYFVGRSDTAS